MILVAIQNMIQVDSFIWDVKCDSDDSDEMMQLRGFEFCRSLAFWVISPVACVGDEAQFCGHCEVRNRDVERFEDFIERAEFFLEPFPIKRVGKRMRIHLHHTAYRKLL